MSKDPVQGAISTELRIWETWQKWVEMNVVFFWKLEISPAYVTDWGKQKTLIESVLGIRTSSRVTGPGKKMTVSGKHLFQYPLCPKPELSTPLGEVAKMLGIVKQIRI